MRRSQVPLRLSRSARGPASAFVIIVGLFFIGEGFIGEGSSALGATAAQSTTLSSTNLTVAATADSGQVEVLSGYRLKYSVATTARKSTIWRLWRDVENWNKFDTLLEYSHLDDGVDFELGATGVIKARGAAKTRFELIEVIPGVSFIEKLKVPLYQSIELHRYFEESESGMTVFSHEAHFKGRLRFLIYLVAASSFKKELPLVMSRLRQVAEQEEADELQN